MSENETNELAEKLRAIPLAQIAEKEAWNYGEKLVCPFKEGIPHLYGEGKLFDDGYYGAIVKEPYLFFGSKAYSIDEDCFRFYNKPGFFAKRKPIKARVIWFNRSPEINVEFGHHFEFMYSRDGHEIKCIVEAPIGIHVESWLTCTTISGLFLQEKIRMQPPGSVIATVEDMRAMVIKYFIDAFKEGLDKNIIHIVLDPFFWKPTDTYTFHIPNPAEFKQLPPEQQTRAAMGLEFLFKKMESCIGGFYGGKNPEGKHLVTLAGWR